ncbi:MAG: hypothetical protein DMG14_32545 [Acidobacteria bacterium]|nr:MAG: hypothetical protein DMG14_32545 [Acidobacteriota bacterium]
MTRHFRTVLCRASCLGILLVVVSALYAQPNPQALAPGGVPLGPPPQTIPPAYAGPSETRIFDIKYTDVNLLERVLSVFGAQINPSPQLHVLSVRAPKEIMPAIAEAIQRLDVPPAPPPPSKNIELIIYVINAADQPDDASLPAPLQPVINQLRSVLSYKGFQVVDTQVVRGMNGRQTQTSGHLPFVPKPLSVGTATPPPSIYRFNTTFRVRGTDKEPVVFLEGMKFGVQIPNFQNGGWQYYDVGINSDVEIPRGQQVVVGKTTIGERALILVMSARVLD